jgi:two-component system LytT family response regulator
MNRSKIKALIVDDETDGRNVLKKLLESFCPEIEVIAEASNIQQAYELIHDTNPEVVFLDIQMPGGNGFELLKKLVNISFEVVFVTSYDQYAIEAIKFSALDYLLKPIEVQELRKAVDRINLVIDKKNSRQLQFVNVIDYVENRSIDKKIIVHHHDKVILLALSDITHMEGERNYTLIYTADKSKYTSSKNLGEFEEMLENYPMFFRIGKSCICNLNHISNYTKGEPCIVNIANHFQIEISRRKKQEFLQKMKEGE